MLFKLHSLYVSVDSPRAIGTAHEWQILPTRDCIGAPLEAFRDESDPKGLSHSRAAGSERYTRDVPRPSRVSVRLKREH